MMGVAGEESLYTSASDDGGASVKRAPRVEATYL